MAILLLILSRCTDTTKLHTVIDVQGGLGIGHKIRGMSSARKPVHFGTV